MIRALCRVSFDWLASFSGGGRSVQVVVFHLAARGDRRNSLQTSIRTCAAGERSVCSPDEDTPLRRVLDGLY